MNILTMKVLVLILSIVFIMNSCKEDKNQSDNVLLQKFDTPFETPPFDKIKTTDFKPALIEAMKLHKNEIQSIIDNKAEPTFENTIVEFDKSGKLLNRVSAIFFNLLAAVKTDEMQDIAMEVSPLVTAHSDEISMNPELFKRIKTLYDKKETLGLEPLALRTLEKYYEDFVRGGANLNDKDKEKLKEINGELSKLSLQFGDNLLKETNSFELIVDDVSDLAGLPETSIAAAAEEAKTKGYENKWVFTVHKPSMIPFLQYAENRNLREKLYKGYYMRGDNNNENDNKKVIEKMVNLSLDKAKLLGFDVYSAYVLDENMAKTPKNVYEFLERIWNPALNVAKNELKEMQAIANKEGLNAKLESWDWWYYAEKLRKAKYDLDEEELKPYLKLENVRDGMFSVANKLYGITFKKITNIPVYYKDVETYEVLDKDGSHLSILYLDYFTRPTKSAGAWMTEFRSYSYNNGKEEYPLVSLVCNYSSAVGNEAVLLSWDDAETLFHEFGHALHGFFIRGNYNRIAGTIPHDMIELPSQVMENWASEPEVLKMYAKHYQTGEPMPETLIEKIQKSGHFNQGFATVEYVAASLLDMDWYSQTSFGNLDVDKFEKASMDKYGLIKEILPRYRSTYFSHIFDGGYSAGYYAYLWAEVLDADAFQAFKESGDIFNAELADKFRKYILSEGGYDDPMEQYVKFRGKLPVEEPLLQKRGLK